MLDSALLKVQVLYIKGEPVETLRTETELHCKVTAVTTVTSVKEKGVLRYVDQDGHDLINFIPNAKK